MCQVEARRRPGSFEPIDDMVGGGPFGLEAGQWTDDTSMALCLAESVLDRGSIDLVDQPPLPAVEGLGLPLLQRPLHPPAICGAGYCVEALEAALWSVNGAVDFRGAVLRAANLGDDADTTAAIAGQLAGARWGASAIPATWRTKVVAGERISGLARFTTFPRYAPTAPRDGSNGRLEVEVVSGGPVPPRGAR